MSLAGRFSTLFVSALGLVLVGFSLTLYLSARVYLGRQLSERMAASLAVLAAAAEVNSRGVEWEPQERVLPLGQEAGPERLRWMVFDPEGHRIDHSRNLDDANLTPAWVPGSGRTGLPGRLADRRGQAWRISQRAISAAPNPASNFPAGKNEQDRNEPLSGERLYPSLVLTVCAPLGPVEATLAALGWCLAISSAAILIIAAILCQRLSRTALLPLTRLAESARAVDAGDPGWCLQQVGTGDELDQLGQAFNDLLARLHDAYQRQRRFSSDASHQLRTPLTVLIGQIEVALRQVRSADEYRRVLKAALHSATQLARITDSLLFLARAENQAIMPDCECVELNGWVTTHLASRATTGPEPSIEHFQPWQEPLYVRAHRALLGQLLENLLDNACKYAGPDSRVVVATARHGDEVELAVSDNGPGICEEDCGRVFESFYRSAQARRQGVPGFGLGLAVVRQIATAHGGSVSVQSEIGQGTCFRVRLPAAASGHFSETSREQLFLAQTVSSVEGELVSG